MKRFLLLPIFAAFGLFAGCSDSPKDPTPVSSNPVSAIIDTHIHLYDTEREGGVPWPPPDDEVLHKPHLPAEFSKVAKAAGVTGVVIVEASDRLPDNKWILDLVADDPDFYIALVGNIDPYRADFGTHLETLKQDKRFVGIRARVQGKTIDYADPQVVANFRLLSDAGLSLDILMNGKGVETIQAVDKLASTLPELRIVANHVLGYNIDGEPPPRDWVAAARELGRNENVWVKVSGLYQRCIDQPASQDPEHYRALLDLLYDAFGEERLVYGSNWPCTKKSGDYASFVKLVRSYFDTKSATASERYFHLNAKELYGL